MPMNAQYRGPIDLPEVISVFPLPGALLLPRGQMPLNIFEPRYLAMIDDLKRGKAGAVPGIAFDLNDRVRERVKAMLPFKPTGAQKRVLGEIAADMAAQHPMNRLLQGDARSEEHTSELQSLRHLVCRLL